MGTEDHKGRVCDFCGEATALLYCRADTAKLCMACDREVHSTNQLFTKHSRWLLCDTCGASPVSIFCYTDNTVFCQNCDWEAHRPGQSSAGLHDRRPLDGFTGCPSVTELLAILGFEDVDKKALFLVGDDDSNEVNSLEYNSKFSNSGDGDGDGEGDFALLDVLAWDCPSIVSVDELQGPNDSIYGHNFQAMEVPPLPKNRNAVCGRHKRELLHQLREMSKSEPCDGGCQDSLIELQSIVPGPDRQSDAGFESQVEPTSVPSYEANAFQWCTDAGEATDEGLTTTLVGSYAEPNHLVPEKDSDVGDGSTDLYSGHEGQSNHPPITENSQVLANIYVRELNSRERETAISRYKEKKKTRRYEKQIRYESRKVRAESRIRIKGRFAKTGQREVAAT